MHSAEARRRAVVAQLRSRRIMASISAGAVILAAVGLTRFVERDPDVEVVIGPAASPSTTVSSAGPALDPRAICPPGLKVPSHQVDRNVRLAAGAIGSYGHSRAGRPDYTGQYLCASRNSIFLYRVAGDSTFDGTVKDLGGQHHVTVVLVDARHSGKTLREVNATVEGRRAELAAQGAQLMRTIPKFEGYVEVGVDTNESAARVALSDLGDKVVVVGGVKAPGV